MAVQETEQFKEAWSAFVEMRKAKGKRAPFTAAAEKRIGFELRRLQADGHDPVEVLWQSTVNGWSGVFPVHNRRPPAMPVAAPTVDATADYLKAQEAHRLAAKAEWMKRRAGA